MKEIVLEDIYTRPNKVVPEYLEVLFSTNNGLYEIGVAHINKISPIDLNNYTRSDFIDALKKKYGTLQISDIRITYDNDKYFLIADKFILVLGYELNSYTTHSTQCFWIVEDIHDTKKSDADEFAQLEKLNFPY